MTFSEGIAGIILIKSLGNCVFYRYLSSMHIVSSHGAVVARRIVAPSVTCSNQVEERNQSDAVEACGAHNPKVG